MKVESAYPECPLAKVDWKSTSDEILAALRFSFGETNPFLLSHIFDELNTNIAAESTFDAICAFGQEITTHNMALINIDEGNDEYCLALVPLEDHKGFIKETKKKIKSVVDLCKQPSKKVGTPAKRVQLSKRLSVEEFAWDNPLPPPASHTLSSRSLWFAPESHYALCQYRYDTPDDGPQALFSSWLDIRTWPPKPSSCSKHVYAYAYGGKCGMWALLLDFPEEDCLSERKRRKDGFVHLTNNPVDETSWQAIAFPTGSEQTYAHVFFIGNDLFLEQERTVWMLKNAATLLTQNVTAETWQQVLVIEKPEEWFLYQLTPHPVHTLGHEEYFVAADKVYTWKNGECSPQRCIIRSAFAGNSIPCGEHSFRYVDRQIRLIELNVKSGEERFRSIRYGARRVSIHDIGNGWIAFVSGGHLTSKDPIALFWHEKSDEWLPLYNGALGRESIEHMEPGPDGTILIFSSNNRLYQIFDLIGQTRKILGRKKAQFTIGDWSDDPEEGTFEWFYPAMEEELGFGKVRRIEPLGNNRAMVHTAEGIYTIVNAEGLWNKLHDERSQKRPAHQKQIYGDGSFEYQVYLMHSLDNLELVRTYPQQQTNSLDTALPEGEQKDTSDLPEMLESEHAQKECQALNDTPAKGGIIASVIAYILIFFIFIYVCITTLLVKPVFALLRFLRQLITKAWKR